MTRAFFNLSEQDRSLFRATLIFLDSRLCEEESVFWALNLEDRQTAQRLAILELLDRHANDLKEPWLTTWRFIEESWAEKTSDDDFTSVYSIQARLRSGELSGAVISGIVDLVYPHIKVERIDEWRWTYIKKPRKPSSYNHLISARLSSGKLVQRGLLALDQITDLNFLVSLANELNSAVLRGLSIGRRIGWNGEGRFWQLGGLDRVYYDGLINENVQRDPDSSHLGIAPSVKLLYSVVERIAQLDTESALEFAKRWRVINNPVHRRLWAAAARLPALATSQELNNFFAELDTTSFWNLHDFPEITELRAIRFSDLGEPTQKNVLRRLHKGPPRNFWPRQVEKDKVDQARRYRITQELKRIELAGNELPEREQSFIRANEQQFSNIVGMTLTDGFKVASEASWVSTGTNKVLDTLSGAARLQELENAFRKSENVWDNGPAERARNWLNQTENYLSILKDFENVTNAGDAYPSVWNQFGYAHVETPEVIENVPRALDQEVSRVIALINRLSGRTIRIAVQGITAWIDRWTKYVAKTANGIDAWKKIWPYAAEATNAKRENNVEESPNIVEDDPDDTREEISALTTPVGRMIGVFFEVLQYSPKEQQAFAEGTVAREMRDLLIAENGRSKLIVLSRLIQALPFFYAVEPDWTKDHLIEALKRNDPESRIFWSAASRRMQSEGVLKLIGSAMANKAADQSLGRDVRKRLVFNLIVESLFAQLKGRSPAVSNTDIQQMIRVLDDEVRASAASVMAQFIRDLTDNGKTGKESHTAEKLFTMAISPFLTTVWPQELSLVTPGVSAALADLPAASRERFSDAVTAIKRFLVPFQCWSLIDYGLYGDDEGAPKLNLIDDEEKARALLTLLDLTVGASENSVVPHDLTKALDRVRAISSKLANSPKFRRLSAAARR